MINQVNVTLLRQFLGLYCLSKLTVLLTDDIYLISLLIRIVSILNRIQLPLFMINKVNVTLLRLVTHDVFLISLLFRIVSSLNIFYLPLFMINKVNVTLLRLFLGLYCLPSILYG